MYWGYKVRYASNISAIFSGCPHEVFIFIFFFHWLFIDFLITTLKKTFLLIMLKCLCREAMIVWLAPRNMESLLGLQNFLCHHSGCYFIVILLCDIPAVKISWAYWQSYYISCPILSESVPVVTSVKFSFQPCGCKWCVNFFWCYLHNCGHVQLHTRERSIWPLGLCYVLDHCYSCLMSWQKP